MTSQDTRSSAEIARDVEANRSEIDGTLAEIRERMSAGRLAGEAWDFASHSGGGAFVRNLGSSVRDNPLPLLLVGAGIAWLMSGRGGSLRLPHRDSGEDEEYGEDAYDYRRYQGARRRFTAASLYQNGRDDPAYSRPYTLDDSNGDTPDDADRPGMGDRLREVGERVRDAAAGVRRSVTGSAEGAGEAWDESVSHLGDRASEYGERVSRGAARLRNGAARRTQRLGDRAWHASQSAQDRVRRAADEQPLGLALAGLAIGAIAGALVRTTATEDAWMGEASDRAREQAREMASRKADEAAEAVGRTADAVRAEAKAQGLTPGDAREATQDLGDRVRKVAQAGAEKAKQEAEAVAGGSSPGQP